MTNLGLTSKPAVIRNFVLTGDPGEDDYLKLVAVPIYEAYRIFKLKSRGLNIPLSERLDFATNILEACHDVDLGAACVAWLDRKRQLEPQRPGGITLVEANRPE